MKPWLSLLIPAGLLIALVPACASPDAGPLWARWSCGGEQQTTAAGPIWESSPDGDVALRPLFSRWDDTARDRLTCDVLWPVFSMWERWHQRSWRLLLLAQGTDFDTRDPHGRYRLWVLPFYFQGRDATGEEYRALFPLGGEIREILGRDEVRFVLFPLWARSRVNDVETLSVLWPIFSRTVGDGVDRLRVFPFYGRSTLEDRYTKRFLLWPLWNSVSYGPGGRNGGGYILFPLWGHIERGQRESWLFLPPLIRFHRGPDLDLVHCPWPFIQYSSGEVDKLYLWPLWGRRARDRERTWFLLWPLIGGSRNDGFARPVRRMHVLPFYYARTVGGEDPQTAYRKLWPLFSYRRGADTLHWRMLALWPLEHTRGVERLWAPWWTLVEHRRRGDCRRTSLLWGLVRHSRHPERGSRFSVFPVYSQRHGPEDVLKEWSILKGLIGYKRTDEGSRWRLLYLFQWGGSGNE